MSTDAKFISRNVTIAHLSDLHFGTERIQLLNALISDLERIKPDIVAISGDFTQRARSNQFRESKKLLDKIKRISQSQICVPGNHDITFYNPLERMLYPYDKFKQYINNNLYPHVINEDVVILGINSTTPFNVMAGFISDEQLEYIYNFFKEYNDAKVKILVMHHNLIKSQRHKVINDAEKIISAFCESKINLVLSGHIHQPIIELLKRNYLLHPMYVITAGTAISTRTLAPNSYNLLELNKNAFTLIVREYELDSFVEATSENYRL